MRPELVLLVLPVLFALSSSQDVGSNPRHILQDQDLALRDNDIISPQPSVTSSLVQVWDRFGMLATSLYKISLVTDNSPVSGRGHKAASLVVPLIIGFKLSGAIVAALAALKIMIFKTAVMSSIALLVSLSVGAKYIYDKLQKEHHEPPQHYYVPYAKDSGWAGEYEVQTGHSEVFTGHNSDLQGHHSEILPQPVHDLSNVQISEDIDAQRKMFRGSPKFKTTVYKTKYRLNG